MKSPLAPSLVLSSIIVPSLALLPPRMDTPAARVMLLGIQQQEDPKQRRRQWPTGPARGLWQFEQGGASWGVLHHRNTCDMAHALCKARGVKPTSRDVQAALEHDDLLAGGLARLNLWWDPHALPAPVSASAGAAFQLYLRTWCPGAWARGTSEKRQELRAKWNKGHALAVATVQGAR